MTSIEAYGRGYVTIAWVQEDDLKWGALAGTYEHAKFLG
jgi:hypothetical protein